jgi:hypothetical protein
MPSSPSSPSSSEVVVVVVVDCWDVGGGWAGSCCVGFVVVVVAGVVFWVSGGEAVVGRHWRKLAIVPVVGGSDTRLFLQFLKQAQEVHARPAALQLHPGETAVALTREHEANLVQSQQG